MAELLEILEAGPLMSIQDQGRGALMAYGVSQGGAADSIALAEGAAILAQRMDCPAIEMAGMGGKFQITRPARMVVTGAEAKILLDGEALAHHTSFLVEPGQILEIGAAQKGVYMYLHVEGGVYSDALLGSCSAHISAGIGAPLQMGDQLRIGRASAGEAGMTLDPLPRLQGGEIRVMSGPQTATFSESTRARFAETEFGFDGRANRMGAKLQSSGEGFLSESGLGITSDIIIAGDIQITGDGTPFVLLCECQTIGGYPRIGTVIEPDLTIVAQARPGDKIRIKWIDEEAARQYVRAHREALKSLHSKVYPRIRDPRKMPDLLSYQLISGAISGEEEWLTESI